MIKKIITTIFCATLSYVLIQPLDASAASVWSFRSAQGKIETNKSVTMNDHQYMNFDLLKSDKLITEAKDALDDYSVVWTSDDADLVWINSKTGQARANKFDRFTEEYGTAKISATITNTKTGKQIVRSFTVIIDNRKPVTEPEAPTVTPAPEVTATPTPTPQVEPDEKTETITTYKKNGIKKITLGSTWKTDVAVLLDTFDFYFGDKVLKAEDILGISEVDCVEVGTPVNKAYVRTISLNVRVQALNPLWENPNHYIVEKVEINHYFDVVQ